MLVLIGMCEYLRDGMAKDVLLLRYETARDVLGHGI